MKMSTKSCAIFQGLQRRSKSERDRNEFHLRWLPQTMQTLDKIKGKYNIWKQIKSAKINVAKGRTHWATIWETWIRPSTKSLSLDFRIARSQHRVVIATNLDNFVAPVIDRLEWQHSLSPVTFILNFLLITQACKNICLANTAWVIDSFTE